MNSKNKILVGCLALLLVLSVGYALFSDTITINGTATAKGSFDITATCEPGIMSKLGTTESLGLAAEGGYGTESCTITDDLVSMNVEFLYPGARRYFTLKAKNTGSIDATYSYRSVEEYVNSRELCIADNKEGTNKTCKTNSKTNSNITNGYYSANSLGKFIAIEDANGNLLFQSEMGAFVDNTNYIITLKPGYSIYFYINVWFDHNVETVDAGEFFAEYKTIVNMPFEQATN